MKRNLTGAEFKRFYTDPLVWGVEDARSSSNATYVDDLRLKVVGVETDDCDPDTLADSVEVEILSGYFVHPQKGVPDDFAAAAAWWKRRSAIVVVVAEVDRNKLDTVVAATKAAGGRVLS